MAIDFNVLAPVANDPAVSDEAFFRQGVLPAAEGEYKKAYTARLETHGVKNPEGFFAKLNHDRFERLMRQYSQYLRGYLKVYLIQ